MPDADRAKAAASSNMYPLRALADPIRRQLLDRIHDRNGHTLNELCEGRPITRQAVTKHLAVLQAANLAATLKRGRAKLHYLNAVPIYEIGEHWRQIVA